MKKLIIALTAIIAMASCKKETVNPPAAVPTPVFSKKVKTETVVSPIFGTTLYTYSFDAQGRLAGSKQEEPGKVKIYSFDYTTPGKIWATVKINDVLVTSYECDVNNEGFISLMKTFLSGGSLYQTTKFTYDANGYMTKKEMTTTAGQTSYFEFTIENGNVTESRYYENGALSHITLATYDLTKYNSTNPAWGAGWKGSSFGKVSKNLITNYKNTRPDGNPLYHETYVYQLNAAGYVETKSSSESVTGYTQVTSFTFE